MSTQFRCSCVVEEDHKKPVYCVSFNFADLRHRNLFATVGLNRACIYRCKNDGGVELLQVYVDDDKAERFYVCKWSVNETTGAPLLLVAGSKGLVRAIDCHKNTVSHTFAGHGNDINDIAVHPSRPSLFLTASKDTSVRLWNASTNACVVILSGEGSHTNEVLTLDFHPWNKHLFLSAGMDNMVKIWSLEEVWVAVEASFTWAETSRVFPTKFLQHAIFSTVQVHGNYVDCVRWIGNLCVSKSVDSEILIWKPEYDVSDVVTSHKFILLQELQLPEANLWWLRFSLDFKCSVLACGNRIGQVTVWNPHLAGSEPIARLKHKTCKTSVRQTAVSFDGKVILASCEDGSIWRWDSLVEETDSDQDQSAA